MAGIHNMNLQTIDLNLLVVFEALMEERGVTRAANRVGLSQPAMSNALARLRRTFDDPLFRVLLLRGIAWSATEPVDRFNALVWPGAEYVK